MSRRHRVSQRCHFCEEELWRIEGHAGTPETVYCYGCREAKDDQGHGFKEKLSGGLSRAEQQAFH